MDYSTVVKQHQTNYNNIVTILSNLTSESSTCCTLSDFRFIFTNVCIFNYNTILTMHDSHIFRKRYIIPNIILYTNRKELCVYKRHIFILRRQTFAGINCKIAAVKQIAHAETIWPIKWKCNFSHSIRKCIKMKIYKDQL
jgi:hypothetical protein